MDICNLEHPRYLDYYNFQLNLQHQLQINRDLSTFYSFQLHLNKKTFPLALCLVTPQIIRGILSLLIFEREKQFDQLYNANKYFHIWIK